MQELNADKKYKLILNATSLVDADSLLDITPLVLAKVNELYAADKKADKEDGRRPTRAFIGAIKYRRPAGSRYFFLFLSS